MSNTLRRKMFKLGGRADTHGVGITSGLKMNKGGRVKMNPGGFVPPRALSGGSILSSLLAQETPQQTYLRKRSQKGQEQRDTIKDFVGQYFTDVPFGQVVSDVGKAGAAQAGGLYDLLIGNPASATTEFFTGVDPEFTARNLIGAENGEPIVDLAGMLLSDKKDNDEKVKVIEKTEKTSAQILKEIQDNVEKNKNTQIDTVETEPSEIEKEEAVNNAIKEDADGDEAIDFESPEDALSFEDQVKRRSELYKSLMETDDKQKVLAQAILAGSTALLEGGGAESYAKAGKAVGDVLSNQADSLRKLRNSATIQGIKDVTATDSLLQQANLLEDRAKLERDSREEIAENRITSAENIADRKIDAANVEFKNKLIATYEADFPGQGIDQYKRLVDGASSYELMPKFSSGNKQGQINDVLLKQNGEGKKYILDENLYIYINGKLQKLGSDVNIANELAKTFLGE